MQARQDLATSTLGSRRQRRARRVTSSTAEESSERVTKVAVEARVNDWVESRVSVTDPEQYGDTPVRQLGAGVGAQRCGEVPREEWKPADKECAHDDAEGLGGLVLSLHQSALP